jgi:hypothetical protein
LEQFAEDVRLVFINCKTYNRSDSAIYKKAHKMWKNFEQSYRYSKHTLQHHLTTHRKYNPSAKDKEKKVKKEPVLKAESAEQRKRKSLDDDYEWMMEKVVKKTKKPQPPPPLRSERQKAKKNGKNVNQWKPFSLFGEDETYEGDFVTGAQIDSLFGEELDDQFINSELLNGNGSLEDDKSLFNGSAATFEQQEDGEEEGEEEEEEEEEEQVPAAPTGGMSEYERKRQENIQRNREMLKSLGLDELSQVLINLSVTVNLMIY